MNKKFIFGVTAALTLTTGLVVASNGLGKSNIFSNINQVVAEDVLFTLDSSDAVSGDGAKSYDGAGGAKGAITVTYSGASSLVSGHVKLAQDGFVELPVNRAKKVTIYGSGSVRVYYQESSSLKGGRDDYSLKGSGTLLEFPREVNYVKIEAFDGEVSITKIDLTYVMEGNCTTKADDHYSTTDAALNSNDLYYVEIQSKTVKLQLVDGSRLFLDGDTEDNYFMYASQDQVEHATRFENTHGEYVVLKGSAIMEKTFSYGDEDGEKITDLPTTRLQNLNSFTLDDYGTYDIACGEMYSFNAKSFNPDNATNKNVTWVSTDEDVMSVVGDGENNATAIVSADSIGVATVYGVVENASFYSDEWHDVKSQREVTFNVVESIELTANFEGEWFDDFDNPKANLVIEDQDIYLNDELLIVTMKKGNSYFATDWSQNEIWMHLSGSSLVIEGGSLIGGVKQFSELELNKETKIQYVKATVGGKEYNSPDNPLIMYVGDDSWGKSITPTQVGGNHFSGPEVEVHNEKEVQQAQSQAETLAGTWSDDTFTLVVSEDEQTILYSDDDCSEVELTLDGEDYYDSDGAIMVSPIEFEGGKGNFYIYDDYCSLYDTYELTHEGYEPPAPAIVFSFDNNTIKAVSAGTGYVKYTWTDKAVSPAKKYEAYVYIEVKEHVVAEEITINGASEVASNGTLDLEAVLTSSKGVVDSKSLTWSSSDKNVATIAKNSSDDTKAKLTAKSVQSDTVVVITCKDAKTDLEATLNVTVKADTGSIPAKYVGCWSGYDDYYCDFTFDVAADGSAVLCDDGNTGTDFEFTFVEEVNNEAFFEYNDDSSVRVGIRNECLYWYDAEELLFGYEGPIFVLFSDYFDLLK